MAGPLRTLHAGPERGTRVSPVGFEPTVSRFVAGRPGPVGRRGRGAPGGSRTRTSTFGGWRALFYATGASERLGVPGRTRTCIGPLRRREPLSSATGTFRAFADLGLAPPLACREPSPVRPSPRSLYGSSRAPGARQVLTQSSEGLPFPGPAMIVSGGVRSNTGPFWGPCLSSALRGGSRAGDLRRSFRAVLASTFTNRPNARRLWSGYPDSNRDVPGPKPGGFPLPHSPSQILVHPVGFEPTRSRFSADGVFPIAPQVPKAR